MLSRFHIILVFSLITALTPSCGALTSGYNERALKSREAILKDDLFSMLRLIDQYSADKGKLPQSLDDLVKAGYLRQIPADPITKKPDWKLIMVEDPNSKGESGMIDIRSLALATSTEGKPYNQW